jgi:vacuolar-type H+-ATPase subunit I/STV1
MGKNEWIVINYNLPTEPSRYRVAVWRGLKKVGAINIQQSMWILPNNEENYWAIEKICRDIELNNGEALFMESEFFEEEHEKRVISRFNTMRDEEYSEFIRECGKYLKEIEKEILKEKFTFSELEEEEAEFDKLFSWHKTIEGRDIFCSSLKNEAVDMLNKIKDAFENYSDMVYQKNVMK